MRAAALAALLALPTAAFVPAGRHAARVAPVFSEVTEEVAEAAPTPVPPPPAPAADRGLAIVPVNEDTVQFTAGSIGAVLGLTVGGPVLAALLAAVGNYLARKDGEESPAADAGKVVGSGAQAAVGAYNSLATFEQDQKLVDSVLTLLEEKAAGETLDTVKKALGSVTKVIDDNDLVGGAGTALNSVGDLLETGLDKLVALLDEKSFE